MQGCLEPISQPLGIIRVKYDNLTPINFIFFMADFILLCVENLFLVGDYYFLFHSTELPKYYTRLQTAVARGLGLLPDD